MLLRAYLPVVLGVCACTYADVPLLDEDGAIDASGSIDAPTGDNVRITAGPAGNATTGPHVVFEFTVADGAPQCRFDNEPLAPCSSPVSVNLAEGIHSFHVQAQDSSGAIDTDSRLWNVDCVAPLTSADSFATYHMDEASGDTLINATPFPAADPPRHGTLDTGVPELKAERLAPGRFGPGALRFPAIAADDAAQINLLGPLVGGVEVDVAAHAFEVWLRPSMTYPHARLRLLSAGTSTAPGYFNYEIDLVPLDSQVRVRLTLRDSTNQYAVESQPIALERYHYVAFSHAAGARPFLFVDGVMTELPRNIDAVIDRMSLSVVGGYEGQMDELHMTFRPFTESELVERWCPP